MSAYLYTCQAQHTTQRFYVGSKRRAFIRCPECGKRANRDIGAEHGGYRHKPGNWPMVSDAAGVHPEQRAEAYSTSVQLGVPTEFNVQGQAIFTSAQHRKRYCEAYGLYDKDGGYSDPRRLSQGRK